MKNIKALLAVVKADLIFTFKNLSSSVFGILFPLIFILAFGFIGDGGQSYDVYFEAGSDMSNPIYDALEEIELINLIPAQEYDGDHQKDLEKGQISAFLKLSKEQLEVLVPSGYGRPIEVNPDNLYTYGIELTTSAADPIGGQAVTSLLSGISDKINLASSGSLDNPVVAFQKEEVEGRKFSQIDFILPGQLGFSLLSAGVFGTAFLLVNLRETLVLKRFFATPVKKWVFILGIAISKLVYSMLQALIIIGVGYFAFNFTLVNGIWTLLSMLILASLGLLVFLGLGLIISSVAKDTTAVAPMANLITMPQFLLAGTFFPIDAFPDWLQPVSRILPLTYLNDAMRRVAFDGDPIWSLKRELLGLGITLIVVYAVAIRVFNYGEK